MSLQVGSRTSTSCTYAAELLQPFACIEHESPPDWLQPKPTVASTIAPIGQVKGRLEVPAVCPTDSLVSTESWSIQPLSYALAQQDTRLIALMNQWRPTMLRLAARRRKSSTEENNDIVQSAYCQAWEQRRELGILTQGVSGKTEPGCSPSSPSSPGSPSSPRSPGSLTVEAQLKNWVGLRVLRAVDRAKYRAAHDPHPIQITDDFPGARPLCDPSYGSNELSEPIAKRIATLPRQQRQVLNMHLDGSSNTEIALALGYKKSGHSMTLVTRLLQQALAPLRLLVRDLGPSDVYVDLFNYCAHRVRYHPAKQPWIDEHPGNLLITPFSIRQYESNLDLAMANPDAGRKKWLKTRAKQ